MNDGIDLAILKPCKHGCRTGGMIKLSSHKNFDIPAAAWSQTTFSVLVVEANLGFTSFYIYIGLYCWVLKMPVLCCNPRHICPVDDDIKWRLVFQPLLESFEALAWA